MSIPEFSKMELGFYRSSAAVFLLCAFAMTAGDAYLLHSRIEHDAVAVTELLLWVALSVSFALYYLSLYINFPLLRARSYTLALFIGVGALLVAAWTFAAPNLGHSARHSAIASLSMLSGAACLGAAAGGMLLGHWYLIDTGLDLDPLQRMQTFFRRALSVQVTLSATGLILLAGTGTLSLALATGDTGHLAPGHGSQQWLFAARLGSWIAALMLAWMIKRTLAIPQTMAATGLFYIAALSVCVGEILAQWIRFRTGIPF